MTKEEKQKLINQCIDADMSLAQISDYIGSGSKQTPAEWMKENSDPVFKDYLDDHFDDQSGNIDQIKKDMEKQTHAKGPVKQY